MPVRKVEYPANQDSPLYRLMFPNSDTDNVAERVMELKRCVLLNFLQRHFGSLGYR